MRRTSLTLWIVFGAVLGGFIVGAFPLQPAMVWSMGAGLAGGLWGALSGWVARRPWRPPLPQVAALLVAVAGVGVLYMGVSAIVLLNGLRQPSP